MAEHDRATREAAERRKEAEREKREQELEQRMKAAEQQAKAAERLNRLNALLLDADRIEDMKRAAKDPVYQQELLEEFGM